MHSYNEIIHNLFISNWYSSNDINFIKNNNIKAVITLEKTLKPQYIIDYYKTNNIGFIYIGINDNENENIYKYFDITFEFIRKYLANNENVLVHCAAGISRSATIIINYCIRTFFENNNLQNVNSIEMLNYIIDKIRKIRPINPNKGFIRQLIFAIETYKKCK